MSSHEAKIKILKDGPYIVTGGVPIYEKIITPKGRGYEWRDGRILPQAEQYALCRCGNSKNAPFCDGTHIVSKFVGDETASRTNYMDRAKKMKGPGIDLLDDNRCAFARFCHRQGGNVWDLTLQSGNPENKREAIQAACDCPAGRLVALEKTGNAIELEYEPSIVIVQDPEEGVSGGIFVRGNIIIESADGSIYETRNRVVLCRCGNSRNKPFCDAMHVTMGFTDR